MAVKVENERAERLLTSEPQTLELTAPKASPQEAFGIRLVLAKRTGAGLYGCTGFSGDAHTQKSAPWTCWLRGDPLPNPLPPGEGTREVTEDAIFADENVTYRQTSTLTPRWTLIA